MVAAIQKAQRNELDAENGSSTACNFEEGLRKKIVGQEETAQALVDRLYFSQGFHSPEWTVAQYQHLVGNEERVMASAQTSLASRSRKVTSSGRMTESIAKELDECLCGIIINASTCLRMLSADSPNVDGARETARRTISCTNRAAEAVSHLRALFSESK